MVCCLVIVFFWIAVAFCLFKIFLKLSTKWCRSQVCLNGKTAIVTGGASGIGYETAIDLAKRGARVIIADRDEGKASVAVANIIRESRNNDIVYMPMDLASFTSVRKFAASILASETRLDILVNNAGVFYISDSLTEDGLNVNMQVNYFGSFLLTNLLLDLLKKNTSRVVNVSSLLAQYTTLDINRLNEFPKPLDQYCKTKLCNILFTIELASRLRDTKVTAYSVHPGVVKTSILENREKLWQKVLMFLIDQFSKTPVEGAQTSIYCAVANGLELYSGEHFHDCEPVRRYESTGKVVLSKELWNKTEEIIKISSSK